MDWFNDQRFMGRQTPEAGGDKPSEQKVFQGSGKSTETQGNKPSGLPENREQWEQRKRLVMERGNSYLRTAKRILEAKASHSDKYDPQELAITADLLTMRAFALGEALLIMKGEGKEDRNEVERVEKHFKLYTKIIPEFSDEKKPSDTKADS